MSSTHASARDAPISGQRVIATQMSEILNLTRTLRLNLRGVTDCVGRHLDRRHFSHEPQPAIAGMLARLPLSR
jgi:hypothetical protein